MGVKGLWRFSGNMNDESGNGYTITPTNITYGQGKFGQSALFNGTNAKLTISDSSATGLRFGTGNFTLAFWIKPNTSTGEKALFNKDPNGSYFFTELYNGNKIYAVNAITSGTWYGSNGSVPAGSWSHVAITRSSGGVLKFYINGVLDRTVSGVAKDISATGTNWTFSSANNYFFNGMLDETIMSSDLWTDIDVRNYYAEKTGFYQK